MNPDEIIESGFAALKTARPMLTPVDLATKARRQAKRAKLMNAAVGIVGCLSVAAVVGIAMRPMSALAALKESVRLSGEQPSIHLHIVNRDESNGSDPRNSMLDIWKFSDRYIRKQGHLTCELFKSGRSLAYDDRIPLGFDTTYDAEKDRFWAFDGSIGVEVGRRNQLAPTVASVAAYGSQYTMYEWRFKNEVVTTDERIYVDPQSKLIRYAEGNRREDGDVNHGLTKVDYPDAQGVVRDAPRFPVGIKFRTKDELVGSFKRAMATPEATKSIGGVMTSLFGVIVYPSNGEGLHVEVISRGGVLPDKTSGYELQVVGGPLLSIKDDSPLGSVRAGEQWIGGVKYIRSQSRDLLSRAPSRITVRVPVWRSGSDPKRARLFVGFVTYTTSRIFYCLNDTDINRYGVAIYPRR